ncbi:hypothetical protein LSCM1_01458 [Leishmania martiniquensis]|uniref:Uncharacterized protein n=1 Tax=Leishmania martiniquensis TaxID=1580590 RepID=A0A836GDB4_9TRYP|nr:hypothetical protein LSCM1_01458 [Leishmania martiniquensis]
MGAAPSAEIVLDAPFLVPQGGARQVALIPIVKQYFPTPDCPLFRQLYEAYTDPSVRYYMRSSFDGKSGDLSRIPPIENSREDLHRLLLRHTEYGMFPTNAAIREVYEVGDFHRIRPVLCAVVFLYEGTSCVPEGSVQLPSPSRGGASAFVKVIGAIGDACTLVNGPDDELIPFRPTDVLKIRTLIMKSAGDHNMSRVVLLAAYIYYHQCCDIIGLPNVPALGTSFTCFKTNIPFLCFLREMRDRMACVLEAPKNSKFFIDDHCIHGAVSREYVARMMPAFACYYLSFLHAKVEQRAMKQQSHQQHLLTGGAAKDCAGLTVKSLMSCAETHIGSIYAETSNNQAVMAIKAAALEGALRDGSNTAPKITYVVKGYITRTVTSISNWSHAANEVYVVCVDGTVTVVDRTSVEASDGPTHTPSLLHEADLSEAAEAAGDTTSAVVATIQVRRGDILSFYVPMSIRSGGANPSPSAAVTHDAGDDDDIYYDTENLDALRFCSANISSLSLSSSEAPSRHDSAILTGDTVKGTCDDINGSTVATSSMGLTGVDGNTASFEAKKGSWRVDDSIFIENVLLSLVRDECKLAREATEQDPGWVYDDANKCLVHDGSFYVWHFRRGHEDFYYGTVPKFANVNRQLNRKNGGGGGGNADQGKAHRGGAGAAKDVSNGVGSNAARGKSEATSPSPPARATNTGKAPAGTLPTGLPPGQRQNFLAQPPSLPQHPQQAAFLPPALASASPDVQQAYLASIAAGTALPPPPAYDASTLSTGQGASVPFAGSTGEAHLKNPLHTKYTTEAAGVPMMYPFVPPVQGQSPMLPAQQRHLPTFPSQGLYSSGIALSSSSSPPQHALWDVLGAGNSQATTAPSQPLGPYMMNAQGQLILLENAMGGGAAPARQVPYAQPVAAAAPQPYPNYVMFNGQLCILQSAPPTATATAPSPPQSYQQYPPMTAFRQ